MGNEISSDASNNVKSKFSQMTPEELKNRKKIAEKYIQIIETELKSRRKKYQPNSKTGNSKTSNMLVVSNKKKTPKPLEKKSKSGGKKTTSSSTHRKINATVTIMKKILTKENISFVKGKNKIYYEKLVIENRLIGKVESYEKENYNKSNLYTRPISWLKLPTSFSTYFFPYLVLFMEFFSTFK